MTDSSANLKRARMRAGLSGSELARRLDMEPGTWRRIERGERKLPFDIARQVAEALDCEVGDLVTGENGGREVLPVESLGVASVDLPVFGTSDLLTRRVRMGRTGNFVQRPHNVVGNDKAYAMHVFNDAAAPRFETGDVITVDPTRPAKPDQWVVVTMPRADELIAEIWRFVEVDGDAVVLSRNDQRMTLGSSAFASIDLIVGMQLT